MIRNKTYNLCFLFDWDKLKSLAISWYWFCHICDFHNTLHLYWSTTSIYVTSLCIFSVTFLLQAWAAILHLTTLSSDFCPCICGKTRPPTRWRLPWPHWHIQRHLWSSHLVDHSGSNCGRSFWVSVSLNLVNYLFAYLCKQVWISSYVLNAHVCVLDMSA